MIARFNAQREIRDQRAPPIGCLERDIVQDNFVRSPSFDHRFWLFCRGIDRLWKFLLFSTRLLAARFDIRGDVGNLLGCPALVFFVASIAWVKASKRFHTGGEFAERIKILDDDRQRLKDRRKRPGRLHNAADFDFPRENTRGEDHCRAQCTWHSCTRRRRCSSKTASGSVCSCSETRLGSGFELGPIQAARRGKKRSTRHFRARESARSEIGFFLKLQEI